MKNKFDNIVVYGAGSWGTALASQVAKVNCKAILYCRRIETTEEINKTNRNSKYLGEIQLPKEIFATSNLKDILNAELIIMAVPSNSLEESLYKLRNLHLSKNTIILIATKGIDANGSQLFSDLISKLLPNEFALLSGPSFAKEVASDCHTKITIAAYNNLTCQKIQNTLASSNFQLSLSSDITSVQIAGCMKNIIAIASGMSMAKTGSENERACLINQGLKEIMLLAQKLGGRIETALEPAVIGDLMLTCYSKNSRNTRFGYELATNPNLVNYPYLVEGKKAALAIRSLAQKFNLYLPVTYSVAEFFD